MVTRALIMDDKRPLLERVREFLCKADAKMPVDKVLLFGSTAKGKRRPESDVDLIIVSKSFNGEHELKRISNLLKLWPYVEELNILAYTPSEFNEVKDRFMMKKILSYALDFTPAKKIACPESGV
jgi:predicted nucleotidyltransferase